MAAFMPATRRGGAALERQPGMPSHGHHSGYICHASRCAVLRPARRRQAKEAEVTVADLLVLAPWMIFGAALGMICYRLLRRCGASGRHQRDSR
jgi:hypothetical protein